MKRALFVALAGIAAGAVGLAAAPAQNAAAARDWTKTVAQTPDGGYRIGNPAAAVKLVEYGSLTCGACARFAGESNAKLIGTHVKSGKVSFEFRNYVRDPADMAAAILSRCASADKYFPLTERFFSSQPQWLGRFQAMTEAKAKEISALPAADRIPRFAAVGGIDAIAAQYGVTPARGRTCLADPMAAQKLAQMRKVAMERHKVEATPTFLINGKTAPVRDWASLEPLLKAPGG